ncbi:hypothetical protein [Schlesneria paludicola]|uniref:hypothetical protein n=1 Tax=Schlesneria paludicola TaxID=360056 RepID=UPI00029AE917|nr:hypothetical protein [Schlesneria paludicola]
MQRIMALTVAILLVSSLAYAANAPKRVVVTTTIPGGLKISTTTTVAANGSVSGSGQITGPRFRYSFAVTRVVTAKGTVTLSGHFNVPGNPTFTLTAAVPSGAQTFKYSIYGQSFAYTGSGTVAIQ